MQTSKRRKFGSGVARWGAAALCGILAVAAGVAFGHLIAIIFSPYSSPALAVGAGAVDHSSASMREFAISTFGTKDKLVLFIGIGVAMTVLATITGMIGRKRPVIASIITAAVGAVGLLAALDRPTATATFAVAPILAIMASVLVLNVLLRLLRRSETHTDEAATKGVSQSVHTGESADPAERDSGAHAVGSGGAAGVGRRRFLIAAGGVAAATVAVAAGAQVLAKKLRDVVSERAKLVLPRARQGAPAPAAGVDLAGQPGLEGVTPFATSNDDFYRIDTALSVPQLSKDEWQLRIHGMVDSPKTLSWDDLMRMQPVEKTITLTCVSNEVGGPLAGNATWLGYPIRDILASVGVSADADMLLSTSVDGWTCTTPLAELTDGRDSLLAIGMNGTPLPFEHGYPVRQVVPGLYGFVSATKWVIDWEITKFSDAQSYWRERGWGEKAPIKTASRIDRPQPLERLPAGPVIVAGTAWAQHRGIIAVEVQVDNGDWAPAQLAAEYSVDTWRQWWFEWDATPGTHTVRCRATDGNGDVQTDQRAAPIPDGASGWHNRVFRIQ